jgi:hypothetical protein
LLVDGKIHRTLALASGSSFRFDTTKLANGRHVFRVDGVPQTIGSVSITLDVSN